jgi:hypothetical protein
MKELSYLNVKTFLKEYNEKLAKKTSHEVIMQSLKRKIQSHIETKAILGFDIYRYSQFPLLEQSLIPPLFKTLYEYTIGDCIQYEKFIFQEKKIENYTQYFIDSGDGGFQIFENPLQAITFAIYFQANIRRYNSGKDSSIIGFRDIVGEITLRYAITYDSTYAYNSNFYGVSIINNARIMAKDKLNRLLIDENTFSWCTKYLHGIENLQSMDYSDLQSIEAFKDYQKVEKGSLIFLENESRIKNADVLKIGEIKSKLDILSIHSLHIQTLMFSNRMPKFSKYTITLGNLNSAGITE